MVKITLDTSIFGKMADNFFKKALTFFTCPDEKNNVNRRRKQAYKVLLSLCVFSILVFLSATNSLFIIFSLLAVTMVIYYRQLAIIFLKDDNSDDVIASLFVIYNVIILLLGITMHNVLENSSSITAFTKMFGYSCILFMYVIFLYYITMFVIHLWNCWIYQDSE